MSSEVPSASPGAAATETLLQNRYEVRERLATGTFFFTHRGHDRETGRSVAIKILKPEFAGDSEFTSRLLAETRSAETLRHPNIAHVYDVWRERGTVVIVTEWVRGINLKERIGRVAPFPTAVATDITVACAEALNYAHQSGFIHGDLRPENIIITPDGRVKITDFGVSGAVAESSRLQLSALPSAAYYLAPEVAQGRPADRRTDVYSLGCILHEMLAGEVPFNADTPLAVAVRHLNDPPPSLRASNPSVPITIEGMTLKCIQKEPIQRYTSMEALLVDLHQVREALQNDRPLTWTPLKRTEGAGVAVRNRTAVQREVIAEPADSGPSMRLLFGVAAVALTMIMGFFGAMIFFTSAPAEVSVPPGLVGLRAEEAAAELEHLNLKADVREDFSEDHAAGIVYDTLPKEGILLRSGKTVILWVSRGSQPVRVPDVVGGALARGREQLQSAGLAIGQIREEFSEIIAKGEVIAQSPIGGTEARKNTAITLIVSKGPAPAPEYPPVDLLPGLDLPQDLPPPDEEGSQPDLEARDHVIRVQVPRSSEGPQTVRIVVRHEDGVEETAYEQAHQPGERLEQSVTTLGAIGRCQIRVYLNHQLIKQSNV
jgi:eukaryotic-like serine/threonine-protein kinase